MAHFRPIATRPGAPRCGQYAFSSQAISGKIVPGKNKQTRLAIKEAAGEDLIWFDAAV
ncbi:hypothetical protein ACF1BQ_001345 [Bradyrhizobium sp. RDT10]